MYESEAAAAEALAAAVNGNAIPETAAPEQAVAAQQESSPVDTGATAEADSFVDIDQLPDELKPLGKQLLGDYTRKTQEVAPVRKLMQETGMSADQAREALTFVQGLNDPNNLRQLYEHLSSQFETETAFGTEFDAGDEDEGFIDPRDQQLQDLQSRLDNFEMGIRRQSVEAELDRQEAVLRQENSHWTDDDFNDITRIAIATNGSLMQAADVYKSIAQRAVSAAFQNKAQVPAGSDGLSATGHAETPNHFENLEDAHAAALRYWAAEQAN